MRGGVDRELWVRWRECEGVERIGKCGEDRGSVRGMEYIGELEGERPLFSNSLQYSDILGNFFTFYYKRVSRD